MNQCEVVRVRYSSLLKETRVTVRISDIASNKVRAKSDHPLANNSSFIIGEIDKSIHLGDLVRCDGLPYLGNPSMNKEHISAFKQGYKHFKLDSGYWVLRRK